MSSDCLCVCLQPSGVGTAQLSKSIFNFTDTQDVRVLVGCNAVINHRGDIIKVHACLLQMPCHAQLHSRCDCMVVTLNAPNAVISMLYVMCHQPLSPGDMLSVLNLSVGAEPRFLLCHCRCLAQLCV